MFTLRLQFPPPPVAFANRVVQIRNIRVIFVTAALG